ncbi:hypothetical protein ACFYKX_25520 [Cytobacillus sp. FJAT-54145]|uniref:Uncharacterized protein n=1 Tax=Cytobacillus spartinae TaxID=3299023 RepID=A0ABW6KID8_9BACI
MKPWVKITLGVLLSVLIIVFIIVWDTIIKDRIDSVEVVIVRPGVVIEKHEQITNDKIMVEKRNRSTLVEGVVFGKEINDVVGYEAKQQLYGNSIISKRSIEFVSFSPNAQEGESIRPIPNEWIYASPSTLRRKDKIDFYLFAPNLIDDRKSVMQYQGLSPEQQAKLEKLNDELEKENQEYEKERNEIATDKDVEVKEEETILEDVNKSMEKVDQLTEAAATTIKGEKIKGSHQDAVRKRVMENLGLTDAEWTSLTENGDIPVLVDIPIIYVKDGSGNEILNGENSSEENRLNSTGLVTDLEVILNEDEYRLIKKYMEKGYKLYITYN